MIVFLANGFNVMSVIYCLLTSALIVLSIIDFRQYIIPDKVNIVILVLGIIATIVDRPRMKVSGANHRLALGPYLSMGIWFAMLFSEPIIEWYLRLCGLA